MQIKDCMSITQSTTSDAQVIKPKKWAEGLATIGLTNMLFMPHFGHNIQFNMSVKNLLVFFNGGFLWLDQPYLFNVELISIITGLPNKGDDPAAYLTKQDDKPIKQKHSL